MEIVCGRSSALYHPCRVRRCGEGGPSVGRADLRTGSPMVHEGLARGRLASVSHPWSQGDGAYWAAEHPKSRPKPSTGCRRSGAVGAAVGAFAPLTHTFPDFTLDCLGPCPHLHQNLRRSCPSRCSPASWVRSRARPIRPPVVAYRVLLSQQCSRSPQEAARRRCSSTSSKMSRASAALSSVC